MQGYAWLYLIAYPIDYIIYAYNYIYGFSLFADVVHPQWADVIVLEQTVKQSSSASVPGASDARRAIA